MAGYVIRGLAQLATEAKGALVQAVQGTAARILPNTWRVESKVLALLGFEHEQRRAFLYDQIFASRAAKTWLRRHGYELGLGDIAAATTATGAILVSVPMGLKIPGQILWQAGNGYTYTTLAAETGTGGLLPIPVVASAPGAAGNLAEGFPLSLVPNQDVSAALGTLATVAAGGLVGGADEEKVEDYRARVLDRKRRPPQGGSAPDYETWANEALGPGILRKAFVDSFQNDSRSVWLCFTVTDQPDGIPSDGQVALVQAYCDDPIRRPVTARVFATAPIPLSIDIEIADLSPDDPDTRASVEEEIAATFLDRAVVGTSKTALFVRAWIEEAISRAVGEDTHELTQPATSIVVSAGYLPVPGRITFV